MKLSYESIMKIINDPYCTLTEEEKDKLSREHYSLETKPDKKGVITLH